MREVDNWVAHKDQAKAAFRDAAEILADFRAKLVEGGFTPEGAERLSDTMLLAFLPPNE